MEVISTPPPDGVQSAAKAAGYTGQLVMASSQLPGDASEVLDVLDRGENPPHERVIAATTTVRECKRNHEDTLIKRMFFSHTESTSPPATTAHPGAGQPGSMMSNAVTAEFITPRPTMESAAGPPADVSDNLRINKLASETSELKETVQTMALAMSNMSILLERLHKFVPLATTSGQSSSATASTPLEAVGGVVSGLSAASSAVVEEDFPAKATPDNPAKEFVVHMSEMSAKDNARLAELPAGQVPGQANRRRLIYVGHAADRIGWRCFDPITFKFVIRYEHSAKKRISALREFDRRRTLARQGKLGELPLEADDFDASDVATSEALDPERRLYPIPLPPPGLMTTSGGGG